MRSNCSSWWPFVNVSKRINNKSKKYQFLHVDRRTQDERIAVLKEPNIPSQIKDEERKGVFYVPSEGKKLRIGKTGKNETSLWPGNHQGWEVGRFWGEETES